MRIARTGCCYQEKYRIAMADSTLLCGEINQSDYFTIEMRSSMGLTTS